MEPRPRPRPPPRRRVGRTRSGRVRARPAAGSGRRGGTVARPRPTPPARRRRRWRWLRSPAASARRLWHLSRQRLGGEADAFEGELRVDDIAANIGSQYEPPEVTRVAAGDEDPGRGWAPGRPVPD